MSYIRGEDRHQGALFPVTLDELIPEAHLVRVIEAYVARLDLVAQGFGKALTSATGRPPYDPSELLKLYLYGYLNQVRSSRRLERECQRNDLLGVKIQGNPTSRMARITGVRSLRSSEVAVIISRDHMSKAGSEPPHSPPQILLVEPSRPSSK
jgi:transposase